MDCMFCRIGNGEIPAKKVYEDARFFAFLDINPRNPGHTLVITKNHYETFLDVPEDVVGEYMKVISRVTKSIVAGMKADGVNVINGSGKASGSLVPHVHFHIIPRFNTEGPVSPEIVLQVKKLDEQGMNRVVDAIKAGAQAKPQEKPTPPKPVQKPIEKKPAEPKEEWEEEFDKAFEDE